MKKKEIISRRVVGAFVVCLVATTLLLGCGGSGGGSDGGTSETPNVPAPTDSSARAAIESYVNGFIIPVLSNLDNAAATLQTTAQAFVNSPSPATLSAVRSAWVAARVPWEQSETALFGPVDFYGFDPALDSWPVNQTDIEAVLASGTALTVTTVANLDNSLRGFHTIEYFIYGTNGLKTADQLTAREGEYLLAATQGLRSVTSQLLAAWTAGIEGQKPYAEEVLLAGQGSTAFPTEAAVLEQIVRGMGVIADEVANGKIADPFDARDPNIVESQFSGNSLTDFTNNIAGLRLAYQSSLSSFVAARSASADAKLLAAIDGAIAALGNIPEPFLEAIKDSGNDAKIVAAQQAIRQVQQILETDILPIVLQ